MIQGKKRKYNNEKPVLDGITFDSKKEADYYVKLKRLGIYGEIQGFEMQVPYELQPKYEYEGKTIRAIKYIADFVVHYNDGHTEVIDVKGFRTPEYKLKKKMLLYQYPGIFFREV